MADGTVEPTSLKATREARADEYFEHDLAGQRVWYSKRASQFRTRAQALGLGIIAAGTAMSFLQVFGAPWIPMATAGIGALIAIGEGWRQIARYDETWAAYRVASERMKREKRLYANEAGEFHDTRSETEAFRRFVENVEAIIAEEQRIYWQGRIGSTRDPRRAGEQAPLDQPVKPG